MYLNVKHLKRLSMWHNMFSPQIYLVATDLLHEKHKPHFVLILFFYIYSNQFYQFGGMFIKCLNGVPVLYLKDMCVVCCQLDEV